MVTLLLGLMYTGRQTTYARRSADNARVSASAAVRATQTAERNVDLVSEQLKIIRDQTGVLERQVQLSVLALTSQDRPAFDPGPLHFEKTAGVYRVDLTNVGRGTGWVTKARLVAGPDQKSMRAAMAAILSDPGFSVHLTTRGQLVSVGQTTQLNSLPGAPAPPEPTVLWLVLTTRDVTGTEAWTYFFVYRAMRARSFTADPGKRAAAVFACRGRLLSSDGEVTWPLDELSKRDAGEPQDL